MILFDDSVTAGNLPATQTHGIYYADGPYANEHAVRARLPKATVAAITVAGKTGKGINFCDCEAGDLTPAQAEAWVAKQIALDVELVGVYANASTWAAGLWVALEKYGDRIKRWCADYDGVASVIVTYDGVARDFDCKQYAGNVAPGVDKNIALDTFFTPYKPPVKPKPKPHGVAHANVTYDLSTGRFAVKMVKGTAVPEDLKGPIAATVEYHPQERKFTISQVKK